LNPNFEKAQQHHNSSGMIKSRNGRNYFTVFITVFIYDYRPPGTVNDVLQDTVVCETEMATTSRKINVTAKRNVRLVRRYEYGTVYRMIVSIKN